MTVELKLEDPRWYNKSEDPVLTCTVHSLFGTINWKRDDLFIGLDGRLVGNDVSEYNMTSHLNQNNTVREEKLYVSRNMAMSSVKQHSAFRCESQGFSSPNIYLSALGNPITGFSLSES